MIFVPFNIYGIGVKHPEKWQVFINPNNKLTFEEGLVKVDRVTVNKSEAASLSIRWGKMKEKVSLESYVDELEKQFNKKEKRSRNKDKYKINHKQKCFINNTKAYLLENEFIANHSIYRVFGKSEKVKVFQMLFFSEETSRMVVASLSAKPTEFAKNKELFMEILSSLHEDTTFIENKKININLEEEAL